MEHVNDTILAACIISAYATEDAGKGRVRTHQSILDEAMIRYANAMNSRDELIKRETLASKG